MLLESRLPHGREGKGSGLGPSEESKSRPEPLLFPALMSLHILRLNANSWHFLVKISMSSMLRVGMSFSHKQERENITLWSSLPLSQSGHIPFLCPVELGRLDGGLPVQTARGGSP